MTTIIAFINIVKEIMPFAYSLLKLYREAKEKKWINDGTNLQLKLNEAKTDEERKELAKAIFNHRSM